MNKAIKFLRDKEWSMGNGQCPECCGVSPNWLGHPLHLKAASIGHKENCPIASSLKSLGQNPVMIGKFKSKFQFENCITEDGCFSTRKKTKHGCPRFSEFCRKQADSLRSAMNEVLNEIIKNNGINK